MKPVICLSLSAVVAVAVFVYTMLLVDVNYTSIHNFYRDRLSEAFVVRREQKQDLELEWVLQQ